MNELIANPFSGTAPATQSGTEMGMAREAHEVQAMVAVAKRFPRDALHAMDRILQACARPGLAESSLYQYSRGGSDISGPSIRLAEAIAQNWGNFQFGFREVARGTQAGVGYSDVEAYAWELETNTRKPITFRVRHWRDTRKGGYALTDERDIYELVANQASRRVRNCILALIPGDVTEAAQRQCEVTLSTHADISSESIKKMVEAFSGFGVTRQQIEARIQRRLDAMTPALMVQLKKIYASLRDNMSSPADWFPVVESASEVSESPEGASKTEKIKNKLKQQNAPAQTVEIVETMATLSSGEQVDTATGEVLPEEDPIADLLSAISECRTREELELHRAAVAGLKNGQKKRAIEAWKAIETRLADPHGE